MFHVALVVLLSLTGCGDKKPAESNGSAAAAASSGVSDATKIPGDDKSKAFANRLIATPARDFKPTDASSGATFIYHSLEFKADNTWVADAKMLADGEEIVCAERGEWSMDAAEANDTASMDWKVTYTNCPGRPKDNIMRVKVMISPIGVYNVAFR